MPSPGARGEFARETGLAKGAGPHLGELEELLGQVLDILELGDGLDARADSLGVGRTRGVEDILDLLLAAEARSQRSAR